ncbi:MAG: hypothetical protein LQ342_000030 [Letrouitia transgressa]|nr:MAG: hypothetical protein LQ342_000030 [Letrouitia transgressa]
MSFLPPGLILAFDSLMILVLVGWRVFSRPRSARSPPSRASRSTRSFMKKASTFAADRTPGLTQYQSLEDDDINLEARIINVRRMDTGFGGAFDAASFVRESTTVSERPKSDLDLFIQSMSKSMDTGRFGLSFEFTNLMFKPKSAATPVLSEVTGQISQGSLWGVMGASGAGKTTFVNVLMGKKAHTGGITRINGVVGDIKKYKKIIGYVPQDDIVIPELTVRENILHSARIRLPASWSDVDIQKHVDILISCLQLAHIKDSVVGSAVTPVISGGQRKRVSIGIELAAAPMALFLDEPTSGLDATSASSIMMTLKELSGLNITVITIIHQPRQEIFESLDSLMLFGAGRVVYQGPGKDVQAYFRSLGFNFPGYGNPADTIMDIIAGQGHLYKPSGDTGIWSLIEHWKQCQRNQRILSGSTGISTEDTAALRRSIRRRGAPWYRQIYYCFLRSMTQQVRLKSGFFFEIGVSALGGFLIGLAEFKQEGVNFRGMFWPPYTVLSSSSDYSSVPQMALLVGIAIGLIASSPGVKIFGEEKLVYWREAASGHNRFAYYVGKVLSTLPRVLVASIHFTATFMLLSTPRISWGEAFVANGLYFYCIYGLASCVSMVARREDGPLLAVMASLIVGVLNGMSPSLRTVKDWHMTWFWRILPGTWLAEGYFDKNISPWGHLYLVEKAAAASGFDLGRYGVDMGVLLAIGTIYRVIAFALLRMSSHHRGR